MSAPQTPIAQRLAPAVKLHAPCCLRCSKRVAPGVVCGVLPHKKCNYCAGLRKPCAPVPEAFTREVNSLLRTAERLATEEDPDRPELEALEQAVREYTTKVEATLRKEVKRGGTRKPTPVEVALLQVDATNRLAAAAEGILDVLRYNASLAPLGAADARSDSGSLLHAPSREVTPARSQSPGTPTPGRPGYASSSPASSPIASPALPPVPRRTPVLAPSLRQDLSAVTPPAAQGEDEEEVRPAKRPKHQRRSRKEGEASASKAERKRARKERRKGKARARAAISTA